MTVSPTDIELQLKLKDLVDAQLYCPFDSDAEDDAQGASPSTETGAIIHPAHITPQAGSGAVQLAEATENLITNPSFETNTTGWEGGGANTLSRWTGSAKAGSYSCKCTYADSQYFHRFPVTLTAAAHVFGVWMYIPSTYDGTDIRMVFADFAGITGSDDGDADMSIRNAWQFVPAYGTPDAGDLSGKLTVYENGTLPTVGEGIFIDAAQCEAKAYPTPYCDGSLGTGHTWSGTAHASTSARTATTLRYAITATDPGWTLGGWFMPSMTQAEANAVDKYPRIFGWRYDDNDRVAISYSGATDKIYAFLVADGVTVANITIDADDEVITRNNWYHFILTLTPDHDIFSVYLDGALIDSDSSLAAFNNAPNSINIQNAGSAVSLMGGWTDDLVALDYALTAAEVAILYKEGQKGVAFDGVWTDHSSDILDDAIFKARYGTFGQRPTDRVANPGSIDFTLDNSPLNSGGVAGYYTPDHGSVRTGFEIGIDCRLAVEYDSDTYYKWVGRLNKALPDAGKYSKERTVCRGRDWIGDAAYIKPEHLDVQTTKRADELLTTAVAALDNTPPATSYATGKSTFAYAFDEIRDGKTTMRQILKNISICELGLINEIGDTDTGGVLTFEDRHERILDSDVLVTLDDTEFDYLIVGEDEKLVFNDIKITAHPRVVDTDASLQTLWELQGDAITIPAGQTETILGNYTDSDNPAIRIGGADIVSLTSDDYAWSGSDSDLGITTTIGGNSTKFVIINNGAASGDLSELKIRGKRVLVYQPATIEAYDSDSIADHDNRPLNLSLPYQNRTTEAQSFADVILSWQKDAVLRLKSVHFTANSSDKLMKAMLQGEPGRRITVTESLAGVSGDYFINGVRLQVTKGDLIETVWYVVDADTVDYFLIDSSLIDGPDVLAF